MCRGAGRPPGLPSSTDSFIHDTELLCLHFYHMISDRLLSPHSGGETPGIGKRLPSCQSARPTPSLLLSAVTDFVAAEKESA